MTPQDTQLFEFFMDISNLEAMKDDYPRLRKFYNESCYIFDNKLYSHINLQDEQGNTFIHYAMQANHLAWVDKLLNMGADPTLLNNIQQNAFHMVKPYNSNTQFWKKYEQIISFQGDFYEKTKTYCPNFKQMVFSHLCKNKSYDFKSWDNIISFLNKNELNTPWNSLKALAYSNLNQAQKINYFLNNFDSPEYNSFFLNSSMDRGLSIFRFNDNLEVLQQIKQFFHRDFSNDDHFANAINSIFDFCEKKNRTDFLEDIFHLIFRQNMNLKRSINRSQHTLLKDINRKPFIQTIYLKCKLHHELISNTDEKNHIKKIKI